MLSRGQADKYLRTRIDKRRVWLKGKDSWVCNPAIQRPDRADAHLGNVRHRLKRGQPSMMWLSLGGPAWHSAAFQCTRRVWELNSRLIVTLFGCSLSFRRSEAEGLDAHVLL